MMMIHSTLRLVSRRQARFYTTIGYTRSRTSSASANQFLQTDASFVTPFLGARFLSTSPTDDELRIKFAQVLRSYRKENYGQSLFSRFLKDLVKYSDENKDGLLSLEEVKATLKKVGVDDQMTPEELEQLWNGLIEESGGGEGVPVDFYMKQAKEIQRRLDTLDAEEKKKQN
jgi:hypothetical protein